MLTVFYPISFLGMILLPLLAGWYFSRKFNLSWKLFLAGGLTFIASQIPHIPLVMALNATLQSLGLVATALILGLLAGLFEETARYVLFKFILKNSRSWKEGFFVGLGHGGTEAILLGVISAATFIGMLAYRSMDSSALASVPPEQLELAKQQIAMYWSVPWYHTLLGLAERVFAICAHLALSTMVLYGLVSKKAYWYWLAVLWHTALDAVAVYFAQKVNALILESFIGLFAIASVGIVIWLHELFSSAENQLDGEGQAISPV
ncbi:MAG: YhfC family intramembrane metalloprotease [Anaerolineales bacterium]|nr:YhfC family intramembrane metalloprotease [Anaerolineales bacterium]